MERTICNTIPETPSTLVRKNQRHLAAWVGSARTVAQALRGDVDKIVMTCLKKSQKERYRRVSYLRDDIERHLSGQPIVARGTSRWYRMRKFMARHPTATVASALALLTLLTAIWVVNRQAQEASRQAQQAEAAKSFLIEMIGRTDPFVDSESITLLSSLKAAIPTIDERFDSQPLLQAELRYAIGYALQNLGETEQSRAQFERALQLRQANGNRVDQAEAIQGLAIVDWWESRYEDGTERFQTALEMLEYENSDRAVVLKINTLANLAAMQTEMNNHEPSRAHSLLAIELAEGREDISDETRANLWGNLATAEESLGNFLAAEIAFDQTLTLLKQSVGESHPSVAIALNNYAFLFYSQGTYDRAIELFAESVNLRRTTLGNDHPQLANALSNLAGAMIAGGKAESALKPASEALFVAQRGFAADHWRIGKAHQMLARVHQANGSINQALIHARDALEILSAAEGDHSRALEELNGILELNQSPP